MSADPSRPDRRSAWREAQNLVPVRRSNAATSRLVEAFCLNQNDRTLTECKGIQPAEAYCLHLGHARQWCRNVTANQVLCLEAGHTLSACRAPDYRSVRYAIAVLAAQPAFNVSITLASKADFRQIHAEYKPDLQTVSL